MHVIAAKAVCFREAGTEEYRAYAKQVVKNCKALAQGLEDNNFRLVSGGTDNHLCLVDLESYNISGQEAEVILGKAGITVNKNTIPGEPLSPFVTSGIRVGTAAVTTRGLVEEDMDVIAECISLVIKDFEGNKETVLKKVADLCEKYPLYQ